MLMYLVLGYLVIGFFVGLSHLSTGKVGSSGPFATLLAHILLWPLMLAIK